MKNRILAALLALVLALGAVGLAAHTAIGNAAAAPTAPGKKIVTREKAKIDYSNTADGYVMVQYTAKTQSKVKAVVKGPTTSYQYTLKPQLWTVLPLSDGEGKYQIGVYENITGTKYAAVCSATAEAKFTDQFAPFLRPNQYVNYSDAPKTVAKAKELAKGLTEPLDLVAAVYDYAVKNLTYDKKLAATVESGYLPDLDKVLDKGKGICFDYAAVMTGMLRSQGVPCKLVVGYAGKAYHAWISVWSEKDGWIDGAVYFDGSAWQRMDPTFASSANKSDAIMKYIGDGSNYSAKYFY